MRRMLPLLVASLLASAPTAAHARIQPWIAAQAGVGTYAMGDINDAIGLVNVLVAGQGLRMEDVRNGFGVGGAVGADLPGGFAVGAGYERLHAQSVVGNPLVLLEYRLRAAEWRAFVRLPVVGSDRALGFVELGVGWLESLGEIRATAAGSSAVVNGIDGHGAAYDAAVGSRVALGPRVAGTAALGYRVARLNDLTVNGQRMQSTDGSTASLDYSGVFLRAGVTFVLRP